MTQKLYNDKTNALFTVPQLPKHQMYICTIKLHIVNWKVKTYVRTSNSYYDLPVLVLQRLLVQ